MFPQKLAEITKRKILRFLASIYDPLGLASPASLVGKLIYQEVCEQKSALDKEILYHILVRRQRFHENLPDKLEFSRSLTSSRSQSKP